MAKGTLTSRQTDSAPRVRRGYFECRYGQLHVHNAIPPGGGFEEGTPLLCLHHSGGTGRDFERFLALGGSDRSVYAPDLPGFGESDAPPGRISLADYAAAVGDFLDTMRFRQIDLLGYQSGSLLAAELAINRPKQVRRVVMVSIPALNDMERDALRRAHPAVAEDGSHLSAEWRRVSDTYGTAVSLELRSRLLAERLRSGSSGQWVAAAAQQYPARERLVQITQPTLVVRPKDEYWDATGRARDVMPKARFAELPQQGAAVFAAAPEAVLGAIHDFLRG
jgi:pimeloyl-ACP methyl ester carboxylesterase